MRHLLTASTIILLFATSSRAQVPPSEICGNGLDDDGDGEADEGCYPTLTTGQCESPLSCTDIGMVSPSTGSLHYSLPPDVAPKVPYGPGIGLRRFYLSQYEATGGPPTFQAAGTQAAGTGAVSPAWPTHQVGDVALLVVETAGGQSASLSDAQGFASVTGGVYGDNVDSAGTRLTLFWKRAASTSEATPTVADSGDHTLAQIVTFRGVIKTGDPWSVINGSATSGTSELGFTMPTVTTTVARPLVINVISWSSTFNIDLFWTLTQVASATTGVGNDGAFAVATQQHLLPGTTTGASGVFSTTSQFVDPAQRQARIVIALKPDATEHKPMGERWSHTYMSWLHKWTEYSPDQVVLHTNRGQDVLFTFDSTASGWEKYVPQVGFKDKFQWIKQRTTSPFEFQARTLTGETIVYDSAGRMIELWDTLQTPNKVLIAYDSNNMVSTVTDASDTRRLLFAYTGNLATSVAFQIKLSGTWTTQHTTTYGYTNDLPTTVTIGGSLAQTNTYVDGHLRQIDDGGGLTIAKFKHDDAAVGKIVRIETGRGTLGWEYNSSRTNCSGKTVVYFNKGNTTSCSVDSDCGSGFLCGGKTASGTTGQCFRAARCLTLASPSEDVVTGVTALGPPSESCEGACLDALSYTWNTGTVLTLQATEDPTSKFITKSFNANGLPETIRYGDSDADPVDGGTRVVHLFYDTDFPGKVTEVRRKSDLSTSASSCSSSNTTGCARTVYDYNADGMLAQVDEHGTTINDTGVESSSYFYTTTYSYNSTRKDLIETIDGPLGGSDDVTVFEYWSSSDPLKNWFVQNVKRKKDSSNFLVQSTLSFDFWGNPTAVEDFDDTVSCMTYDSARGYLSQFRETMAGQTDCTSNSADLETSWERDSHLRLTKLTRPDGSCAHSVYDSMGRLEFEKRRDDCTAGSSGDTMQYFYSADGLLTKIEMLDASNTVKRRQELTYFDSRRLEKRLNPVNTAKYTGFTYDARGLITDVAAVDGSTNLSHTSWTYDNEGRVATENRFTSGSTADTWTLLFDWLGNQKKVTDEDSKVTESQRDDLGRIVKLVSPDLGGYPTLRLYDPASRLFAVKERFGGSGELVHLFTFDNLGRPLESNYQYACTGSAPHAEIVRVYDAPPASTCPSGMTCGNTSGRLAYVKVILMCSATYAATDGSLDQETWFQYDAAGRVIREYIKDDSGRVADHLYAWSKNGALSQVTTPSGAVLGSTYGSGGHNSDTDRTTALWRTSTSTPIIDNILWNPFGPLQQYNQMNTTSSNAYRTKVTRNLAYRISAIEVEKQSDGSDAFAVAITEDAKGRVITRDYSNAATGVQDSHFLYDEQDRVLCETTSPAGSCPTSGSTIKNSHTQNPPFTAAGDWKRLLRPIPGSTGLTHDFSLTSGTHQIASVNQSDGTPTLGSTVIGHNALGNRDYDDNQTSLSHDRRNYFYDMRRNVTSVNGQYKVGNDWHQYIVTSAFDAKNRRVYKSFYDEIANATAEWFFYYDALDRLVEVRHTPDISAASTYSLHQLSWLGDRLVLYWQTDYPSATTSKRYVGTDESGRPIDMWSWPSSGDTARVWAIDPSAWGGDTNKIGPTMFQPFLFAGQYQDSETLALHNDGATIHRFGVALSKFRTYDSFSGVYLQVDPLVDKSWNTYVYADGDPVGKTDPMGLLAAERVCDPWNLNVGDDNYDDPLCYWRPTGETGGGHTGGSGGVTTQGTGDSGPGAGLGITTGPPRKCRIRDFTGEQDCETSLEVPIMSPRCMKARAMLQALKKKCQSSKTADAVLCMCPLPSGWVSCGVYDKAQDGVDSQGKPVTAEQFCAKSGGGLTFNCRTYEEAEDSFEFDHETEGCSFN